MIGGTSRAEFYVCDLGVGGTSTLLSCFQAPLSFLNVCVLSALHLRF